MCYSVRENIIIEHYYAGKHCKLPHKNDFDSIRNLTRMHSSRMRTTRLLTVSQHALAGRCTCQGVYLPGGGPARGMYLPGGVPAWGVPARGVPVGVYLQGGVSARGRVYLLGEGVPVGGGCTCRGGTCWGVYLPGGVPAQGVWVYLLGVYLPRRVPAQGVWVYLLGVYLPRRVPAQVPPPVNRMTDRQV